MKRSLFLFLLFTSTAWAAPVVFCELASLPVLPLASDSGGRLPGDELLARVAESYRGLLEFGGEEFSEARLQSLLHETSPENFFEFVPGRDQRSVALNESLTKLGDWVVLESEDFGLTPEMIVARLREVVLVRLGQTQEEQERVEDTREERADLGRQTTTGHVFVRDTRYSNLGEAWRDPHGMVWGDVVADGNGKVLKLNHADALKYCQEIGAELPSREDFARLREYMGAALGMRSERMAPGYSPQILPGLKSGWFWSSSAHPDPSYGACHFTGYNGDFNDYYRGSNLSLVRCVARPETGRVP